METFVIKALTLMGAFITLARSEPALDRIGPSTPALIRVSFYLIAVAALWQIALLVMGEIPSVPACLVFIGTGALLLCDRRLRILCPNQRKRSNHAAH